RNVTGVQACALPISLRDLSRNTLRSYTGLRNSCRLRRRSVGLLREQMPWAFSRPVVLQPAASKATRGGSCHHEFVVWLKGLAARSEERRVGRECGYR